VNLFAGIYSEQRASTDGLYRYCLTRATAGLPLHGVRRRLLWIMCNPSTASHEVDDPTIRRVRGFTPAIYEAFDVVNLYAYRATDPDDLRAAAARLVDVVGPRNDEEIARAVADASAIVVAWGAVGPTRWLDVATRIAAVGAVVRRWRRHGVPVQALGATSRGAPRHPLFVRSATGFVPWGGWAL
jgi:hypothetical protein